MNVLLCSFSTLEFRDSQKLLHKSARAFGIQSHVALAEKHLFASDFYRANRSLFSHKRGFGYYAWKPWAILEALNGACEDDWILYVDSGARFVSDPKPFLLCLSQSHPIAFLSCHGRINKFYTRRHCFESMKCNSEAYIEAEQALAGFLLLRKCTQSEEFVREWAEWCTDIDIVGDVPTHELENETQGFIEHRHDQSVLTNLVIREKFSRFRDASQWGNHLKLPAFREAGEALSMPYCSEPWTNSPYGTIFDLHRSRSEKISGLVGLVKRYSRAAKYRIRSVAKMASERLFRNRIGPRDS